MKLLSLVLLVFVLALPFAAASDQFYLSVKGQKQGVINGDATAAGWENSIEVLAFSFGASSPRDAGSGMATGKTQFQPFVVTKRIDKSSPQLFQALTTGENLPDVKLSLVGTDRTGKDLAYYTVTLTNAAITGITDTYDPSDGLPPHEAVSFTYQKIQVQYAGGAVATADAVSTV